MISGTIPLLAKVRASSGVMTRTAASRSSAPLRRSQCGSWAGGRKPGWRCGVSCRAACAAPSAAAISSVLMPLFRTNLISSWAHVCRLATPEPGLCKSQVHFSRFAKCYPIISAGPLLDRMAHHPDTAHARSQILHSRSAHSSILLYASTPAGQHAPGQPPEGRLQQQPGATQVLGILKNAKSPVH